MKHAVEHALSDLSESGEDPRLPAGQGPAADPRLAPRQGPHLRARPSTATSAAGSGAPPRAAASARSPSRSTSTSFPANADDGWSFAATVDVQPLPEIVDWTELEVPRAEIEVPAEAIDAEIEALRESVAELAPANGRPRSEGDTLVVDLVDPAGEAQRDTVVELGAGHADARAREGAPRRRRRRHEEGLLRAGRRLDRHGRGHRARGAGEDPPAARRRARPRRERVRHARRAARVHRRRRCASSSTTRSTRPTAWPPSTSSSADVQGPAAPPARPSRAADLLTGFVRSLERRGVSLETYLAASGTPAEEIQRQFVLEAAVSIARELALEALAAESRASRSPTTR